MPNFDHLPALSAGPFALVAEAVAKLRRALPDSIPTKHCIAFWEGAAPAIAAAVKGFDTALTAALGKDWRAPVFGRWDSPQPLRGGHDLRQLLAMGEGQTAEGVRRQLHGECGFLAEPGAWKDFRDTEGAILGALLDRLNPSPKEAAPKPHGLYTLDGGRLCWPGGAGCPLRGELELAIAEALSASPTTPLQPLLDTHFHGDEGGFHSAKRRLNIKLKAAGATFHFHVSKRLVEVHPTPYPKRDNRGRADARKK